MKPVCAHVVVSPLLHPRAVHFPRVLPALEVTSSQRSAVSAALLTLGAGPLPHLSNPDAVPLKTPRADSFTLCLPQSAHCLSDITPVSGGRSASASQRKIAVF